jgi:uncharacterized protein (TIGR00369 family)
MTERIKTMLQYAQSGQMALARTLGMEMTELEPGRAVLQMEAGPQHANPMGTVHGGVLTTLADIAMGAAYVSLLEMDDTFTTLELKINFLRPVWRGRLTAVGTVRMNGKSVGLAECDITDDQGRLIAHASSTCLALRGELAAGRRLGDLAAA